MDHPPVHRVVSTLASISCLCAVAHAKAGPVIWHFAGELTSVIDDDNRLGGAVGVGTPFSGSFTFDQGTPDSNPSDETGLFADAIVDVTATVGLVAFLGPSGARNSIEITNANLDSYFIEADVSFAGETFFFQINLGSGPANTFFSDSLLTMPPDLAPFARTNFLIGNGSEVSPLSLFGKVSSLVPEPGSLTLLLLGFLACSRRIPRHLDRAPH